MNTTEHVHCGVAGHADPGEAEVSHYYTREQVNAALDAGANLVMDHIKDDQGETSLTIRDASLIDLAVNAASYLLDDPDATLDEVIEGSYTPDVCADDDDDLISTVLGWIE